MAEASRGETTKKSRASFLRGVSLFEGFTAEWRCSFWLPFRVPTQQSRATFHFHSFQGSESFQETMKETTGEMAGF